jgi:uncharacterized protein
MPPDTGPLWWVALAALGFIVGVIAGLFGVGGGFLLTPLLAILFRVPLPIAVGSGLCQMIGVAISALFRHQKLGQGEIKLDWMMMAGSILGVGLGARGVEQLEEMGRVVLFGHVILWSKLMLSLGYIALLTGGALWMSRDLRRRAPQQSALPPFAGPLTRLRLPPMTRLPRCGHEISAPLAGLLGLALGFVSGILGVGGGILLMPILLYGIGMSTRMAAGTGILVLAVTSLVGTLSHALQGNVHLGIAMCLLAGSTIGTQIGAILTSRLPTQRLVGLFVYLIYATAIAIAFDLGRVLLAGPRTP